MEGLRATARNSLLELAWSAWASLGVAGWERRHDDWLLDPDTLAILAAGLGDLDPRLRDEVLDWCCQFPRLLSRSRIRTLLAQWPGAVATDGWGPFAATLQRRVGQRWPGATEPRSFVPSGKSALNTGVAAALSLRLRAAVGVSARAEVLSRLLVEPARARTAGELAPLVGYGKRNVADALSALHVAGLLTRVAVRNELRYELGTAEDALRAAFGPLPGFAPLWGPLLAGLTTLIELLGAAEAASAAVRTLEARRALRTAAPLLIVAGQPPPVVASGTDAWQEAANWSLQLLQHLAQGGLKSRTPESTTHDAGDRLPADSPVNPRQRGTTDA